MSDRLNRRCISCRDLFSVGDYGNLEDRNNYELRVWWTDLSYTTLKELYRGASSWVCGHCLDDIFLEVV